MQCTTMAGSETRRVGDAATEQAAHRRLVRTLVVACIVGGMWLAARDVGFAALGTLVN